MTDQALRVRAFLDARFLAICGSLVVLALLGGWLAYGAYLDPGTTVEQRPGPWVETEGRYAHSATVVEDNPVYPVGETLSNRSVYFTGVTPELDGTFAFAYDASGQGDVDVTVSQTLVHRAVEGTGEDGTVVWRRTQQLEETTTTSVEPGESVRVGFSVNASRVQNRTERIREELGQVGQSEAVVRTTVHLQGEVNGEPVDRRLTYELPLSVTADVYRVDTPAPAIDREETSVTVAGQAAPSPVRAVGGPLLLVGSLGALVALLVARKRGTVALTDAERERLAYEDARSDFEEWITVARLPPESASRPRVAVTSLAGLVDLAIDTDDRVLLDADRGTYCVLRDGFRYEYDPPVDGTNGSRLEGIWKTSDGTAGAEGEIAAADPSAGADGSAASGHADRSTTDGSATDGSATDGSATDRSGTDGSTTDGSTEAEE